MREMGLLDKWRDDALNDLPPKQTPTGLIPFSKFSAEENYRFIHSVHSFSLDDISGMFSVIQFGSITSFICLICEILTCFVSFHMQIK